jgi:enoyl-CoA hydratase/carnithine racemase
VLHITLADTTRRNALSLDTVDALISAVSHATSATIVIASADPKAFCSGADTAVTGDELRQISDHLYELYGLMITAPAIIVAAVDGPAIGGGAQIAAAADLRVASSRASFQFVGAGHGLAVGAWVLPSLVGRGRALHACLSMRPISGDEGHAIGLVDEIDERPEQAALKMAEALARLDSSAASRIKQIVSRCGELERALAAEREANRVAWDGSTPGRRREPREAG